MPLKLENWGQILINYYKNDDGDNPPSSFNIDIDTIVACAKTYDPEFVGRLGALRRGPRQLTKEETIFSLFVQSVYPRRELGTATSYDLVAQSLNTAWRKNVPGADLCVLALLIAAVNADADRQNNYYERLKHFLIDVDIISDKCGSFSTPFFNALDLQGLVRKVNSTCEVNEIPLTLQIESNDRGRSYADLILSQCLINGTLVERFKRLFGLSGFSPLSQPDDAQLLKAFEEHHRQIGIADKNAEILMQEPQTLTTALRKAFGSWDGTTTIKVHRRTTNTKGDAQEIEEVGETIETILLAFDRGFLGVQLCPYLYSEAELETDERNYVIHDDAERIRLYQGRSTKPIKNIESDIRKALLQSCSFSIVDNEHNCKAVFTPKDYYLLYNEYGVWVETTSPTPGSSYVIMINDRGKVGLEQWLKDNEVSEFTNFKSPIEGFELLQIPSLKTEPGKTNRNRKRPLQYQILNFEYGTSKTIVPDKNCELRVWINNEVESISTCYISSADGKQQLGLTNNEDGTWSLNVRDIVNNRIRREIEWKLYCNTKSVHGPFKLGTFILPDKITQMCLDWDGKVDERNGQIKGLELPSDAVAQGAIVTATQTEMDGRNDLLPKNAHIPELDGDWMLYTLTSASSKYITLKEAERICTPYFSERDSIYYLLNDWYAMGYVNLGLDKGQRKVVVNRPTLILLPPQYEEEQYGNLRRVHRLKDAFYTCLLTGARSPQLIADILKYQSNNNSKITVCCHQSANRLMPRRILIHAKNLQEFVNLSRICKIDFQKCIYSVALFQSLPSIEAYDAEARNRVFYISGEASQYKLDVLAQDFQSKKLRSAGYYKTNPSKNTHKGYALYNYYHRQIAIIDWKDGSEQYEVGRNWGLWIDAHGNLCKLATYADQMLTIPGVIALPRIYQRALCFLCGDLPSYDDAFKVNRYTLPLNPTAARYTIEGNALLQKLGQIFN